MKTQYRILNSCEQLNPLQVAAVYIEEVGWVKAEEEIGEYVKEIVDTMDSVQLMKIWTMKEMVNKSTVERLRELNYERLMLEAKIQAERT